MFALPASLRAFKNTTIEADDIARYGTVWAKAFAPILWFHREESFYPQDCGEVLGYVSLVQPDGSSRKVRALADLGRESEEAFFRIDGLDMKYFKVYGHQDVPDAGPEAVSRLARKLYSNRPASGARALRPVCYTDITSENVNFPRRSGHSNRPRAERYLRRYNGRYLFLKYFFFYLYNDGWNKHVGDWDSTVQLAVPYDVPAGSVESHRRTLVVYSQHGTRWIADRRGNFTSLKRWLSEWDRKNYRMRPRDRTGGINYGRAFFNGTHPYGFAALGGHGIYPTPGYSQTYIQAPNTFILFKGEKIAILSDERELGQYCVFPQGTKGAIARGLGAPSIRGQSWAEYHVLNRLRRDRATWIEYRGRWGQSAPRFDGWDGPDYPWNRKRYNMKLQTILREEEMKIQSKNRYEYGKQPRSRVYNINFSESAQR